MFNLLIVKQIKQTIQTRLLNDKSALSIKDFFKHPSSQVTSSKAISIASEQVPVSILALLCSLSNNSQDSEPVVDEMLFGLPTAPEPVPMPELTADRAPSGGF